MNVFNAFQITAMFSCFPFLIGWLFGPADFPGSHIAKWVAVLIYAVYFCVVTGMISYATSKDWT